MMTAFEQRGFERIVDAGLRFAERIDELERELAHCRAILKAAGLDGVRGEALLAVYCEQRLPVWAR
jgi:hypothetical protein